MPVISALQHQIDSLVAELLEAMQQYVDAIEHDAFIEKRKQHLAKVRELQKQIDELTVLRETDKSNSHRNV